MRALQSIVREYLLEYEDMSENMFFTELDDWPFKYVVDVLDAEEGTSDIIIKYSLLAFERGVINVNDLRYLSNSSIYNSNPGKKVVGNVIKRRLKEGGYITDELAYVVVYMNTNHGLSYHKYVVKYGSNSDFRMFLKDNRKMCEAIRFLEEASKYSRQHIERVLDCISYNTNFRYEEILVYYLRPGVMKLENVKHALSNRSDYDTCVSLATKTYHPDILGKVVNVLSYLKERDNTQHSNNGSV